MKCPHCHVEFHAEKHRSVIVENERSHWLVRHCECPACLQSIIELGRRKVPYDYIHWTIDWRLVEPLGAKRKLSEDIPRRIADDFAEACAVLKASPKASAALSRR